VVLVSCESSGPVMRPGLTTYEVILASWVILLDCLVYKVESLTELWRDKAGIEYPVMPVYSRLKELTDCFGILSNNCFHTIF
jgi:hypothetical protein